MTGAQTLVMDQLEAGCVVTFCVALNGTLSR